jgi:cyclophilin family peptidyl-prolyl cis-trans isomerase
MSQRITTTRLTGILKRLNGLTKHQYKLEFSYGGVSLARSLPNACSSDVYGTLGTKSELYYQLYAICQILENEKNLIVEI